MALTINSADPKHRPPSADLDPPFQAKTRACQPFSNPPLRHLQQTQKSYKNPCEIPSAHHSCFCNTPPAQIQSQQAGSHRKTTSPNSTQSSIFVQTQTFTAPPHHSPPSHVGRKLKHNTFQPGVAGNSRKPRRLHRSLSTTTTDPSSAASYRKPPLNHPLFWSTILLSAIKPLKLDLPNEEE